MEITDFCFLGHAVLGPRIISKIVQKGVLNPTHIQGNDVNRVYYVGKMVRGYQIMEEGKDAAFGKHILGSRYVVTVDGFQGFLQQLAEVFLPEKKPRKRMSDDKQQKIIDMVKVGIPSSEIAQQLNMKPASLHSKVYQLRKKGLLPKVEEMKIEAMAKKAHEKVEEPTEVGKISTVQNVMTIELGTRVKSAITLAAAMLVMGVEFTDDQLAERAVNITDKILERIGR